MSQLEAIGKRQEAIGGGETGMAGRESAVPPAGWRFGRGGGRST